MDRKKLLKSKRNGSAMALVLLAVVILLVIGAGLLNLGLHGRSLAARTSSEIAARCAADAGLTKALYEMNGKLNVVPWDDSTLPQATHEVLPNGAIFSYTVVGNINSGYSLQSIGISGEARRAVRAALKLKGLFEFAVGAVADIALKSKTTIDGYNSADLSDTDIDVAIVTNSTSPDEIVLNMGATVNGDVLVGVGGDPEVVIKDQGGTITGDSYAMTQEIEFPPITAPLMTDMGTGIEFKGTTVAIGPADNGQYTNIHISSKKESGTKTKGPEPGILTVDGGDVVLHVSGDIWLGNSCEIVVKPGSSLTLYLEGDLIAGNDASINNQNDPAGFKLYGTGESQKIELKAKDDFCGAIYAPDAFLFFHAWGDIYGSTLGYNVSIGSPSNFYYYEALAEVSVDDEGVRFVVERWQEE